MHRVKACLGLAFCGRHHSIADLMPKPLINQGWAVFQSFKALRRGKSRLAGSAWAAHCWLANNGETGLLHLQHRGCQAGGGERMGGRLPRLPMRKRRNWPKRRGSRLDV